MVSADLLGVPLLLVGLSFLSLLDLRIAKGSLTSPAPSPPTHSNGGTEGAKPEENGEEEDEKSGEPIEEDTFWSGARRRKAILGGAVLVVVLLRCFALGWDGITGSWSGKDEGAQAGARIAEDLLLLGFWVRSLPWESSRGRVLS